MAAWILLSIVARRPETADCTDWFTNVCRAATDDDAAFDMLETVAELDGVLVVDIFGTADTLGRDGAVPCRLGTGGHWSSH